MTTSRKETTVRFSELAHFTEKQKQADALVRLFKYVLYGGAMGGGKSYWLRWQLLKLLLKWAKQGIIGVTVGLFCEDYPALKDRHLSKIGKEFPEWIGTYHADHKEYGRSFILAPEYGSGVIVFRNLDDPSKYQSAEFAAIGIDELTKNPEEVFDDLRTRLRWPGIIDVRFLAATNPGGIGHAWVKRKWIDGEHDEHELEADQFAYLPALAADNPHLDESYLRSLSGLPEDKRKAFLEGDWDIFKGQYFSEWRRQFHVVEPFNPHEFWYKFVSIDYGYDAPSAVYWHGIDGDGVDYVYRELYQNKLTYEQLAAEIVAMTPATEEIHYWVADPAIWAKRGETELSGMELMFNKHREITGRGINIIKGNNDRINGWNLVREYLKPFQQQDRIIAKLQVFSTCTELIRTLPSLIYDKHRVEDLDTDGEDHCLHGDTLVDTDRGSIAIRDLVGTEGLVATLVGGRPFQSVRRTGENQPVFRMLLEDGRSFVATGSHPLLTNRGWVTVDSVNVGYDGLIQLDTWKKSLSSQVRSRSFAANIITSAANTFSARASAFISRCGSIIAALFQRVITSIIRTMIAQITGCRIWLASLPSIIYRITRALQRLDDALPQTSPSLPSLRRVHGIAPKPAESGTARTGSASIDSDRSSSVTATSAAWAIGRNGRHAPSSAIRIVKREPCGHADVYNLHVPGVEHFTIERGLVVHNSADSVRYGVMSRPKKAPKPVPPVQAILARRQRPSPGGANVLLD